MEASSKSRGGLRRHLNTLFKQFDELTKQSVISRGEILGILKTIETQHNKIIALDDKIYDLLLKGEVADTIIDKELQEASKFHVEKNTCQAWVEDWLEKRETTTKVEEKRYKLPTIKIREFGGDLKDWLSWWSQFEIIHNDDAISNINKFQYLTQCLVPGSPAKRLVEAFPQSPENYPEVIKCLQERFGKEDLLSELYVRDFLSLVIARINSKDSKNALSLSTLYDEISSKIKSLTVLKITPEKYSDILNRALIESCLPTDILTAWQRKEKDENVKCEDLLDFIYKEVLHEQKRSLVSQGFGLSLLNQESRKDKSKIQDKKYNLVDKVPTAAELISHSEVGITCIFCKNKHESKDCWKARNMSSEEKRKLISDSHVCFICLKPRHAAKFCRSKVRCQFCSKRHYLVMCQNVTNQENKRELPKKEVDKSESVESLMQNTRTVSIPMQTLTVELIGKVSRKVRVVLDSGAQRSCILTRTAESMGYKVIGQESLIHTLFGGSQTSERVHQRYEVLLKGLNNNYRCKFECIDQQQICGSIPLVINEPCLKELNGKNICLTNNSHDSSDIELLIGNDVYGKILTGGICHLNCGLIALETKLGWVLSGKLNNQNTNIHENVAMNVTLSLLNDISLTELWNLETIGIKGHLNCGLIALETKLGWVLSGKLNNQNTNIHENVAMNVTLSLLNDISLTELWNLETIGIKDSAESKTNKELEAEAKRHFLETVRIDDAGRYEVQLPWILSPDLLLNNKYVAVKRLKITSTKLKNLKMWDTYGEIFKEWLKDEIIEVVPEDMQNNPCHYLPHRAVVRPQSLTTKVRPVFDASCKTKQSLSLNDCLEKGPNLLELIPAVLLRFGEHKIGVIADIRKAFLQISIHPSCRDFLRFLWWEDRDEIKLRVYRHRRVVFGVNCSPFLLGAVIEFHLSRVSKEQQYLSGKLWRSMYVDNCVASVDSVEDLKEFKDFAVQIFKKAKMDLCQWETSAEVTQKELAITKVLGLGWNKIFDTLNIEIHLENLPTTVTKRIILSLLQKIYDPLGFLSPVTLKPKLMLQEAWMLKIGWDEEQSQDSLHEIENLAIPRHFSNCRREDGKWTLHIFCDASKSAYASAAFLRSEYREIVKVQLLFSKSRVSPVKKITIPRLELLACLIGARLKKFIKEALKLENRTYMWSDSSTAITWIQRHENWGTFVENRVQEIRSLTSSDEWNHVPGNLNPADLPSRGCDALEFMKRRWWEGPEWLRLKESLWPIYQVIPNEEIILTEKKKTIVVSSTSISIQSWYDWKLSKYSKIVRVFAYIFRWKKRRNGNLTVDELNFAEKRLFLLVQQDHKVSKECYPSMKLIKDDDGILRVVTKIIQRNDAQEFQYPILLPGISKLVELLIQEIHQNYCHAGVQTCMRILREKFWIPKSRQIIKKIIRRCGRCRRFTVRGMKQEEASLPAPRVMDAKVFQIVGIDLTGPLYLKGGSKVWVVIFTCAVYRCVHLELATSVNTETFIQAFRRFVSRRIRPSLVYTDQGRNFVGMHNILKSIDWKIIQEKYSLEKIEWRLNPPAAPWWGGFWERLIRIMKGLLIRVLGKSSVNYEELSTVLCEVESVINSRPLTYVSEDSEDLLPLTPNMFIKEVSSEISDLFEITADTLRRRYKYRINLLKDLRTRFRNEYLSNLVQRAKEQGKTEVKVGDVVLVGSENKKRLTWPLARILEVIPGRDGVVRVVKLQTEKGMLVRPIQKLYPLEMEFNADEWRNYKSSKLN